jgi:hypothetical protein
VQSKAVNGKSEDCGFRNAQTDLHAGRHPRARRTAMTPSTRWKALLPALAVLALLLIFGWASPQLFGNETAADLSGLTKLEPERVLHTPGPVTKLELDCGGIDQEVVQARRFVRGAWLSHRPALDP